MLNYQRVYEKLGIYGTVHSKLRFGREFVVYRPMARNLGGAHHTFAIRPIGTTQVSPERNKSRWASFIITYPNLPSFPQKSDLNESFSVSYISYIWFPSHIFHEFPIFTR